MTAVSFNVPTLVCTASDGPMDGCAVHTMLLKASSPMPLAVAYLKPLRGWMQPVGQLSAAVSSLSAIRDTLLYLMTSAAVSWLSVWCFVLLLHGQGMLHLKLDLSAYRNVISHFLFACTPLHPTAALSLNTGAECTGNLWERKRLIEGPKGFCPVSELDD